MKLLLVLVTVALGQEEGKVCWKSCQEDTPIQSVHMLGCHRRSSYPDRENFRCKDGGNVGPPCTTRHGEIFYLDFTFNHTGFLEGELTQSAGARATYGALSYSPVELPWATLDPQGCDYLTEEDGHQGCSGQGGTSRLQLPILVEDFYPANTYSVQYYLKVRDQQIACVAFPLRICNEGKCGF